MDPCLGSSFKISAFQPSGKGCGNNWLPVRRREGLFIWIGVSVSQGFSVVL